MIKVFDVIMLLIDSYLFTYFIGFAMDSSDISIRIVSCALATFEVFFLKNHLTSLIKKKKMNQ